MLSVQYQSTQRERAVVGAFQLLPRELQAQLRKDVRDRVIPLAMRAVSQQADTPVMRRIAGSARSSVYRGVPGVSFGGSRPVTSTGVPGRVLVRGLEFGSPGNRYSNVNTRRGGTRYTARKRTTRQFMPDRVNNPTAVYPAMDRIADDVLDGWVELVESAVVEAFGEG